MKEEIAAKLSKASSPEEVIEIFKESEQEITHEQAQKILDQIKALENGEELSLEDLDKAAGGNWLDSILSRSREGGWGHW